MSLLSSHLPPSILRKDLIDHHGVCPLEPVACPFSDIGCRVNIFRQDLDKHIQSSMFQHMTDMALQLTALKHEHEALIKDYTSLKKDHTALKEDHTALMEDHAALEEDHTALKGDHAALKENNRARMNAMGLFLNGVNLPLPLQLLIYIPC